MSIPGWQPGWVNLFQQRWVSSFERHGTLAKRWGPESHLDSSSMASKNSPTLNGKNCGRKKK